MTQASQAQALRVLLEEVSILLDGVAETFWSARIKKALLSVDPNELLSWFGGMGSFNDLVIARVNGHQVTPQQEQEFNARLDDLRERIYELATQLRG